MFKTEYSFMEQDTLYIIGNGFDIAHGLSTQYQNFKKWLLKSGLNSFARRMETLYPDVKNDTRDTFSLRGFEGGRKRKLFAWFWF